MHRPTYAELTSTLALFIALGGVSWAATTLPANSVGSATIRNGQVRGADLAAGSVSASKLSKELRTQLGVKTGGKGGDGASGSNGANGSNGAAGTPGPAGPAGAAGRDGAAIVARGNFGSHTVVGTTFAKIGELTWSQPAGAIDDIRGVYTWPKVIGCGGSSVAYRILVDGIEVSQDWGNGAPDTEQPNDPDAMLAPPYALDQDLPDRSVFGAELPVLGGEQPTTHKLEMFLRRKGCQPEIPIQNIQLFVTRFAG